MDKFYEIDNKAINMFNEGVSLTKIAAELSVDRYCLGQRLKDKFKINPSLKQGNKKYSVDESFFRNIDTESKSYWLGFIFADGHIRKKSNTLEIGLSSKDKEHLFKFLKDIKSDTYVKDKIVALDNKQYCSCFVSLCNKHIYNDLIKLGCTNNKTYDVSFPDFKDKKLLAHFLRGFFDGDGSIATSKNSDRICRITFTAYSEDILEKVATLIRELLPDLEYKIRRKKDTNSVSLYIEKIKFTLALLDIMYKNSTVYLDRKKNLYIKNAAYRSDSIRKKRAKSEEVLKL